ncbi:hypothetical protein JOC62_000243 [Clostridium sardiniense]|nr:hypothetical protein [Clostridium sardiniense]
MYSKVEGSEWIFIEDFNSTKGITEIKATKEELIIY